MKKDFIDSAIVRQNVLNNSFAVAAIQKEIGLTESTEKPLKFQT